MRSRKIFFFLIAQLTEKLKLARFHSLICFDLFCSWTWSVNLGKQLTRWLDVFLFLMSSPVTIEEGKRMQKYFCLVGRINETAIALAHGSNETANLSSREKEKTAKRECRSRLKSKKTSVANVTQVFEYKVHNNRQQQYNSAAVAALRRDLSICFHRATRPVPHLSATQISRLLRCKLVRLLSSAV